MASVTPPYIGLLRTKDLKVSSTARLDGLRLSRDAASPKGCLLGLDKKGLVLHNIGVLLDHPATQQWKEARIRSRLGQLPSHPVLIPVGSERESIADVLPGHGFDPGARAFVSWPGTVCYLTRGAIEEALTSLDTVCAPVDRYLLGCDVLSGRLVLGVHLIVKPLGEGG
jgi:hypothetical protein